MDQFDRAWQFRIDVGGTFTDCIGVSADGEQRQFKTLSSGIVRGTIEHGDGVSFTDSLRTNDPPGFWHSAACRLLSADGQQLGTTRVERSDSAAGRFWISDSTSLSDAASYELDLHLPAPVLAIRWLLRLKPKDRCPPVRIRFGTTRGTNALLTRNGAKTALLTTKGFADIPLIGNQDRPDLFDLNIKKPDPLFRQVFEIDERIAADGRIIKGLDLSAAETDLRNSGLHTDNFDSVAICLMHAWSSDEHERQLEKLVREFGFSEISRSSEVSPLIRIVPRCDTTVLDAYLNPVLRDYLNQIRSHLPGSDIQVMTSTGGLVSSDRFRGRDCILSGPAGGIVGFSKVAEAEGFANAIGFDMGGTSTDVARFDGQFEFENETTKAGVRIMTPVLAIETVAAGGGSICGFDGTRLFVGPQSAGADPGPACYGAGGPLTVTDLNVFLGRVLPNHFPFRLQLDAVRQRLEELRTCMAAAGVASPGTSSETLAEGLLQIANDNMVQAIRRVSVAKGYHPADFVLVSFGGAGGQHACAIARSLGIRKVLIHPLAGILSAWGMGRADIRAIRQASVLQPLTASVLQNLEEVQATLESQTRSEVAAQGISEACVLPARTSLELRYRGTDSALTIEQEDSVNIQESFEQQHRRLFGYIRPDREIEIAAIRVESVGVSAEAGSVHKAEDAPAVRTDTPTTTIRFDSQTQQAKIYSRHELQPGDHIFGPAIVCEPTSTILIEPDCEATICGSGTIIIDIRETEMSELRTSAEGSNTPDPVLLEVFNNQFVSIAEQMGETLRRTSTSTNVRERLDFSCALFDADGQLVVNAPHVPVHLGAMGETVRAVVSDHPDMQPGDVFVTNDPFRGGSHLPDVTVVTPVYPEHAATDADAARNRADNSSQRPSFFVASRAHHAEIGGIVPGSMPPFSRNLSEEGVLIKSRRLVNRGRSCEEQLKTLLNAGPYPSRAVDDNLADLAAQAAANECGAQLLQQLTDTHSVATVQSYMKHIQTTAARKMRLCLQQLEDKNYQFTDELDDGTRISVSITVHGDQATVDFTGTDGVHKGNLNANRAITTAAVLYSFRCLLNEDVPLNAGVLTPVKIIVPPGLLNPPAGESSEHSPAIVGGNVETSQRIVDVLLGALGLAAASQGTMNNLTFGDDTFGYYETICGGSGATQDASGTDGVHTHMTNTRLTDPEVLEQRYPVRLRQFSIRSGSGGHGQHRGGSGVVRDLEFLRPLHVSMLSQRRHGRAPYGIAGGGPALIGKNTLVERGQSTDVGGAFSTGVTPQTVLRIETPGGGGYGQADG